ncbi:MAG: YihY/virulence factor BrkB family protein, partial [Alphaproteobacteria bacterium]|nr:YihY/virulence factor BrkB family protein [Alphaproteobacteria bacterium]
MTVRQRFFAALREATRAFLADDALGHGAAIAFYTLTAFVPVLYIILALVGDIYGRGVAQGAMAQDLQHLVGPHVAKMLNQTLQNAASAHRDRLGDILDLVFLTGVASGAFGEIQAALNAIWNAQPESRGWRDILRTRLKSLGLVLGLALLMVVSMIVTTFVTTYASQLLALERSGSGFALQVVNFVGMWIVFAAVFAAMYRILPRVELSWRDVGVGGILTGLLFQLGQIAL